MTREWILTHNTGNMEHVYIPLAIRDEAEKQRKEYNESHGTSVKMNHFISLLLAEKLGILE